MCSFTGCGAERGRAIDYGKGCNTGQEVIVRIRDRGADLFVEGEEGPVAT